MRGRVYLPARRPPDHGHDASASGIHRRHIRPSRARRAAVATHVERSIEVQVPVRTAYDQWTQFEEFPRFMSGVQEIGGVRREWDAAILEQVPDEKVAWAATTGATNAGAVYFTEVDADTTRVRLTLDYEPEGIVERVADVLDLVERKAVADLDRFKEY